MQTVLRTVCERLALRDGVMLSTCLSCPLSLAYVHMDGAAYRFHFVRIVCAILDDYKDRHAQVLAYAVWLLVAQVSTFHDKIALLRHLHDDVFDSIDTNPQMWDAIRGVCERVQQMDARKRKRESSSAQRGVVSR